MWIKKDGSMRNGNAAATPLEHDKLLASLVLVI